MNPNTVFSASLVTSLVLWYPSMQACLRGDLDLAPAGLRYLAALLASRLALGGLARLVAAYHPVRQPAPPPAADGQPASPAAPAPASPGRRRGDRDGDGNADRDTLAA